MRQPRRSRSGATGIAAASRSSAGQPGVFRTPAGPAHAPVPRGQPGSSRWLPAGRGRRRGWLTAAGERRTGTSGQSAAASTGSGRPSGPWRPPVDAGPPSNARTRSPATTQPPNRAGRTSSRTSRGSGAWPGRTRYSPYRWHRDHVGRALPQVGGQERNRNAVFITPHAVSRVPAREGTREYPFTHAVLTRPVGHPSNWLDARPTRLVTGAARADIVVG